MFKNVLVTVDGSELSEKALDYACGLVDNGGVITLLSVVDIPDISAYGMYPMPVGLDYYTQTMNYAKEGTAEYVNRLATDLREKGYSVREVVGVGDAAETIVDQAAAKHVDAIVISTHGRTGVNQWLFGSVTQKVLNRMPCPVFVVPGFQPSARVTSPTKVEEKNFEQ